MTTVPEEENGRSNIVAVRSWRLQPQPLTTEGMAQLSSEHQGRQIIRTCNISERSDGASSETFSDEAVTAPSNRQGGGTMATFTNRNGLSKKTPKAKARTVSRVGAHAVASRESVFVADNQASTIVGTNRYSWTFSIIPPLRGLAKNGPPTQSPQTHHNRISTARGLRKNRRNHLVSHTQDEVTISDSPEDSFHNEERQGPARSGSSSFDSSQLHISSSLLGGHQPTSTLAPVIHSGDIGLVVARAIQDDPALTIMDAEEIDQEELRNKRLEEARRQKGYFLVLGLVIACVVVGVILGVVHHHRKKDFGEAFSPAGAPSLPTSEAPSSAPTGALDLLREGLPEYTRASLERFDSPQWKAWDWLENHPQLPAMEEKRKVQLFSLATFYHSMDGENWRGLIKDKWLQYDDECFWFSSEFGAFGSDGMYGNWETSTYGSTFGVTPCNGEDEDKDDGDGEFQSLTLAQLRVSENDAFIPPEISLLTSLSILSLPLNGINSSISGFLPQQLYQMSNLTMLVLHTNNLTGSILTEFGRMTSLTMLDLDKNRLSGSLTSELGLMTSLTALLLYGNSLNGSIPTEVGQVTRLTGLNLHSNRLGGSIPSELGSMRNLSELALSENSFNGPLPSELGAMTSLSLLYLFSNSLTGSIPSEVGRMTSMVGLFLHENALELEGRLPSELGLMTNMTDLSILNNSLTGSIPFEVGRMTNMVNLLLSNNTLSGTLPSELGLMTSTAILFLSFNSVNGTIPKQLGRMTSMVGLALNDNTFTGPLPSELGQMTGMTSLWLHGNSLNGPLPSELGLIANLIHLRLENNALTGTVPIELEHLMVNGPLTALSLGNNPFSGTIPAGLCSLGLFNADIKAGLSFDCNDQLCGCCWCPCPGSDYSTDCETSPFVPRRDDKQWPGSFPLPANRSDAVTINIRTDKFPEETSFDWSLQDDFGLWEVLESGNPHPCQQPKQLHH